MKFAKVVFTLAGIYGLLILPLGYFTEAQLGRDFPPAVTHPEYYYAFLGVGMAWQLAFLLIGRDPARYRVFMLPGLVEKFGAPLAVAVLYAQGRLAKPLFLLWSLDWIWFGLFLASYLLVGRDQGRSR
ncbi:MAG: hypothetical protein IPL96_07935 [Holophagaceae bacterium]|nr:hypothetical protein [Holophagaceae bacterium]